MGHHHSTPAKPKVITNNTYNYAPTASGHAKVSLDTIHVNASGKNDALNYNPRASGDGENTVGTITGSGFTISGVSNTAQKVVLMNLADVPTCSATANGTVIHQVTNKKNLNIVADKSGNLCV